MNSLWVIVVVMGICFWLGDVLDAAIKKDIRELAARKSHSGRATFGWGQYALFHAFRFSKQNLDRIFGEEVISPRPVTICLAVALITTAADFGYSIHTDSFSSKIVLVGVTFGALDAVALVMTRRIVNRVADGDESSPLLASMISLCAIAYFTMGTAWCALTVFGSFWAHTPMDVAVFPLIFIGWLPSLIFMHDPKMTVLLITALPSAFTTMLLLVTLALPALFVVSLPVSRNVAIWVFDRFATMPTWTGKAIGLVSGGILALLAFFRP